jgi:hypothetical protein
MLNGVIPVRLLEAKIYRRQGPLPLLGGPDLVDERQQVVKVSDAVHEVRPDVSLLDGRPSLLDVPGHRERVVDALLPVDLRGLNSVPRGVAVPQLERVVAQLDPEQRDLGMEEVGHVTAAGDAVVQALC